MKRSNYRLISGALTLRSGYAIRRCMFGCLSMYLLVVCPAWQAFRLATWSKHRVLTFLSSVSVERDKSGLTAALAASRYLVTFQTVGVGGLSQARPGWEENQGQVIHYCPGARLCAYGFNISLPRVMSHPHPQTHTWLMQNDRPTAGGFGPTVYSLFCEWVWSECVFFPLLIWLWWLVSHPLPHSQSPPCPLEAMAGLQSVCMECLLSWPISVEKARWPGSRNALALTLETRGCVADGSSCVEVHFWPCSVSPKKIFSSKENRGTGALNNSLWFLLVATDKHMQKKPHGYQHG